MSFRFDFLIYFLLCKSLNILGSEVEYDLRFLQDRDVTYAELESHRNFRDGLWTALDGVVYDLTNYVHPGGRSYLLYAGGIEGDETYLHVGKKYHYLSIAQVVNEDGIVRIGPLVGEAPPPTAPVSPAFPVSPVVSPASPVAPITPNAPTTPVKAPEVVPSVKPRSKPTRVPVSSAPVWSMGAYPPSWNMGASKPATKSPDANIDEVPTSAPTEKESNDTVTSDALETTVPDTLPPITTVPDTLPPITPPPVKGNNSSEYSPPTSSSGIHEHNLILTLMIGVFFYSWLAM